LVAEQAKTLEGKPGALPTEPGGAAMSPQAMVENLRDRMAAMPPGRRNTLLASVAFLVAAVAAMVWYVQRPDWKVLFSGMDARDAAQVTQELTAAGIPNRISADGSGVEVPSDAVDKARIEVAAKGMPQSGRMGFELFDKPNWVGSEFDERVNYQRALEGELEHTIQTLGVVRSARVHLVLPQQSLFASEDKVAKASVVLKLKRSAVDPGEADSIRSLVAGAVDNLSPADVVLVDADGRVNLKPHSQDMAEGDKEQELEAKLVSLLEPLAGRDNVRATVRLNYDQGTEDRVDEVYDPTQVATLNMQRSEQSSTSGARASGVPGTASNTPAASAKGAVQGSAQAAAPGTPPLLNKDAKDNLPVYPQGGPQGQTTKQESGSYAVSKHTTHSEMGPGRLARVTAAVVVNDRMATEGSGKTLKTVWKPRTPEEMHRLEELAQAAVGYDAKRGDQVVIENMSFSGNSPEPPAPLLDKVSDGAKGFLRTQPNLFKTLMIGVCGLLLVMFVLKPVGQQVMETLKEPVMLAPGARPVGALEAGAGSAAAAVPGETTVKHIGSGSEPAGTITTTLAEGLPGRKKSKNSPQAIFDAITENIKTDATQSTRLLQGWISSGEEQQEG
jgi:flagellar M-ring protein FliF